MLVLLMVLGAVLGLLVLWFTVLRHERTMRRRARLRPGTRGMTLTGIGPEAVAVEPVGSDEIAAEAAGASEPEAAAPANTADAVDTPDEDTPDGNAPEETSKPAGAAGQRKLTDEILSRVESELAVRATPRWKELAALVHDEYGVTVHPTSIQKAVKRRRLAAETA
jgi:hypothetical protein